MNFDFITERLAIGQKIDSEEFASALIASGVTHVVNLWSETEPLWSGGPVLSFLKPQEDDGTPRNVERTREVVRFAIAAFKDYRKVYVHCQWGLGRAPSMAYAILRTLEMKGPIAAALINERRPRCAEYNWEKYIPSVEEALAR